MAGGLGVQFFHAALDQRVEIQEVHIAGDFDFFQAIGTPAMPADVALVDADFAVAMGATKMNLVVSRHG